MDSWYVIENKGRNDRYDPELEIASFLKRFDHHQQLENKDLILKITRSYHFIKLKWLLKSKEFFSAGNSKLRLIKKELPSLRDKTESIYSSSISNDRKVKKG
jgi:hypothetical protein